MNCKMQSYKSVHNCIDIENQIPPSLPLQKGGIPLFGNPFPVIRQAKRG
jgi:hypothetical protein